LTHVTIYYQVCSKCGKKFSAKLYPNSTEVRIGKETYRCSCGEEYSTGHREWANLAEEERRGYFVSSAEIGVVIISTAMPALFAYFVFDGWRSAGRAAVWGLLVGLVIIAFLWTIKIVIVKLSKRRVPVVAETFGPPGLWPWQW